MKRGFFRLWKVLSVLWVGLCVYERPWERTVPDINRQQMESNKNKAWLQGLGSTGTFSGAHRSQQAETDRQNKKRQLAIARSFKQNPLVFTFGYPIIGGFAGIIVLWIVGGFKSKMKPG